MAAASRLKLLEVIVQRLVLLLALGLRLAPVLPAGRRVLPLAPRTWHRRHRPAGPGQCWAGIVVGNEDRHVVIHASFHAFCRTVLPLRSQVQPLFRRYLRRQVSMDWTRLRGRGNCSPWRPLPAQGSSVKTIQGGNPTAPRAARLRRDQQSHRDCPGAGPSASAGLSAFSPPGEN